MIPVMVAWTGDSRAFGCSGFRAGVAWGLVSCIPTLALSWIKITALKISLSLSYFKHNNMKEEGLKGTGCIKLSKIIYFFCLIF